MGRKEVAPGETRYITVEEFAKHLSCRPSDLYTEIERFQYSEEQGVHHPLRHKGRRGIRIDEFKYLHWMRMPVSVLGDARLKEAAKIILSMVEPLRTVLTKMADDCHAVYDGASERLETEEEKQQEDGLDR